MSAAPRSLHWPEYIIEAGALGVFMLVACGIGTVVGHPASPLHQMLPTALERQAASGALIGLTAVALIYSPWGRRSGAHMNPAVTLTFLRLGKVAPRDAVMYIAAQFVGGVLGVLVAKDVIGMKLADPAVHYIVTKPGPWGPAVAFAAELAITCLQMTVVLTTAASPRWSKYTGVFAGVMVALYITIESPLSGMSMNPARSLGSAAIASDWQALWIYFTAPPLGMLLAAAAFTWRKGRADAPCAKMSHSLPCIHCEYVASRGKSAGR
ncbi:MAG: aquaporin [Gemmatimonadaceae bacterium]